MKYPRDFSFDLLCLKSDIFIARSEDINVAMATVISTNNKLAFRRLRALPLLLPVISIWLQVIKTNTKRKTLEFRQKQTTVEGKP